MTDSQKSDMQTPASASTKAHAVDESQNENQSGKSTVSSRLAHFERRQNELWRVTFLLLMVLATVFAIVSWDTVRSLTHRYEALPIGLVILIGLFGAHVWKRTQEISELRGLVQGIEQRDSLPPDEKQMNQLFDMISRSQQGYRDLIDSFDDILIAVTLEGEIRARESQLRRPGGHTVTRKLSANRWLNLSRNRQATAGCWPKTPCPDFWSGAHGREWCTCT